MDLQTVVLALIQGLTEFLPISSSAHLLLPKELLGWPDQGLAFDVAVHLGSLIAVLVYFRTDLTELLRGLIADAGVQRSQSWHLLACLVVATIPAGLAGLLFQSVIESHLRSATVIAITTLVGALLLWMADSRNKSSSQELAKITLLTAFLIGVAQVLALIPGTSRSGITITMALFLGLSRTTAARFSFLMSIPVIALSGAWQGLQLLQEPAQAEWARLGFGMLISGVSAFFCIGFFLRIIERVGMLPFVLYRLLLGTILLGVVLAAS